MFYKLLLSAAVAAALLSSASTAADEQDSGRRNTLRVKADLRPKQEVPSVSSEARGRFKATIDQANQTISYEVSYEGLEGNVTQSHIHVGQRAVNGGISVFLCGTADFQPPEGFPAPPTCPASPATVTGVITPANIIGPMGQGIDPTTATVNQFDELIDMLRRGLTYANVHSERFGGGEVRGQIAVEDRKH
jgi:CHRD domain